MAVPEGRARDPEVTRLPWEPRHEWDSRTAFVEDHVDTYGLEKAVNLSLVWSNMKFLGCSYPPRVEEKVAHYPVPDMATLRARRKRGESSKETPGRPRSVLGSERKITKDSNEVVSRGPTLTGAGSRETADRSSDGRGKDRDATDFGEGEVEHELLSETAIAAQLDALIADVRKRTESVKNSTKTLTQPSSIPTVLQAIGKTICLCDTCLGQFEPPVALQKLNVVLQRYGNHDVNLIHSFENTSLNDGSSNNVWTLKINGIQVGGQALDKKQVAKKRIAKEVFEMLEQYQETHGKPQCPREGRKRPRKVQHVYPHNPKRQATE